MSAFNQRIEPLRELMNAKGLEAFVCAVILIWRGQSLVRSHVP